MVSNPDRPLNTFPLVEYFLETSLNFDFEGVDDYNSVPRITANELTLKAVTREHSTLGSDKFRHREYRTDKKRIELCDRIVSELIVHARLKNDEDITLGKGGAISSAGFKDDRQAYIIIGLPASGKSGIATQIADKHAAGILDSDYAKRKLPEYRCVPFGASLVHDESDEIVFGAPNKKRGYESMFEVVAQVGMNLVIPKIGNDVEGIEQLAVTLGLYNYSVHLTLVDIPKDQATRRAVYRFMETDRYVPLALIHDTFGEKPSKTYMQCEKRNKQSKLFVSFGELDNNVSRGDKPRYVEGPKENPAWLFNKR